MSTFENKLKISASSGAILGLINLPQTYKFINNILPIKTIAKSGCPNHLGQLFHILVFAVSSYFSMPKKEDNKIKLKYTIYASLMAFFLMSPAMFKLTGSILGSSISNSDGCPSLTGLLLHVVVYIGSLVGLMYLPN
jgi:hypothetical protein